jgi:hypothetical protein
MGVPVIHPEPVFLEINHHFHGPVRENALEFVRARSAFEIPEAFHELRERPCRDSPAKVVHISILAAAGYRIVLRRNDWQRF